MQVVSDRGIDLSLEQLSGLDNLHLVPLLITLANKTYQSGVDIQPEEFYKLLENTHEFPTTSQPSTGDFVEIYRKLASEDPDILSVHISSGLSGTVNAAAEAAKLVPEANVTIIDTKTLSAASGWQVEAAARAALAGWSLPKIQDLLKQISKVTETVFTLDDLSYLIHGGRISHIKGLLASVLRIKPVIGVEKEGGTYVQRGQARTFKNAVNTMIDMVTRQHPPGSKLRLQVMHAHNPDDANLVRERLDQLYDCTWLPISPIAPVLGAHTGPSLIGIAFAPQAAFSQLPW